LYRKLKKQRTLSAKIVKINDKSVPLTIAITVASGKVYYRFTLSLLTIKVSKRKEKQINITFWKNNILLKRGRNKTFFSRSFLAQLSAKILTDLASAPATFISLVSHSKSYRTIHPICLKGVAKKSCHNISLIRK